jgi:hypothetical protein
MCCNIPAAPANTSTPATVQVQRLVRVRIILLRQIVGLAVNVMGVGMSGSPRMMPLVQLLRLVRVIMFRPGFKVRRRQNLVLQKQILWRVVVRPWILVIQPTHQPYAIFSQPVGRLHMSVAPANTSTLATVQAQRWGVVRIILLRRIAGLVVNAMGLAVNRCPRMMPLVALLVAQLTMLRRWESVTTGRTLPQIVALLWEIAKLWLIALARRRILCKLIAAPLVMA